MSFNGKDYKALAQCAPFVLWKVLDTEQRELWLSLSKVYIYIYMVTLHEQTKLLYFRSFGLHTVNPWEEHKIMLV